MRRRTFGVIACLIVASLAAGCGPRDIVTGRAGLKELVRTELYFGMSMPDGKTVSEAEWQTFVDEHITPKFKDGLTIVHANGQYLDKSKKLIRERTKVVILIHPDTPRSRIDIFNIINAYKARFRQESVLRVTGRVGASF
ncbi:MAG: DUF3574 domain-containing protein [Planctomycetota bacterium]